MKKSVRIIFTMSLVVLCTLVSCFAIGTDYTTIDEVESSILQVKVQLEIQRKFDATMKSVYTQLEEQDALQLLPVYESILLPRIERQVMIENGVIEKNSTSGNTYTYGAIEHYYSSLGTGEPLTEVTVTYYDKQYTEAFLAKDGAFSTADYLEEALGYVPWDVIIDTAYPGTPSIPNPNGRLKIGVSIAMDLFLRMPDIISSLEKRAIAEADDRAMIIDSCNEGYDTSARVVLGWEDYASVNAIGTEIDYDVIALPQKPYIP